MDERDSLDRPEGGGMELVIPFVVCRSAGGPYEDESFVAGFQAGQIEKMLHVAATTGADRVKVPFAVASALTKQLDLIGMHHGFPVVELEAILGTDEYEAMPQWSFVVFARGREGVR